MPLHFPHRRPLLAIARLSCLIVLLALGLGTARADATPPRVVVTLKPIHALMAAVMDGVGTPDLLLAGAGTSPHGFALRPSDMRKLTQADLVVWVGPTLEAFLRRPLQSEDISHLSLIEVPGLERLHFEKSDHADEHGHGHNDAENDIDPHIWLTPANARIMARAMAERLAVLDPDRADVYRANTDKLVARLTALETRMRTALTPHAQTPFAVYHDGYAYLIHAFGLNSIGHVTVSPERMAGAAHMRALRQDLRDRNVRCLFLEPGVNDRHARNLIEGLAIRIGELDPLGLALPAGADHYERMMETMARALGDCLG